MLKHTGILNLLLIALVCGSCTQSESQKVVSARADSLYISVRCVKTVTGLIADNFLLPGQKKIQYKMDYVNETWPDTISQEQARKLSELKNLHKGFEKLLSVTMELQARSATQLEQLKKLNNEINSGAASIEDLRQYLNFESRCADTLNHVLDSLVKSSIDLRCKTQSL